MEELGFIDFRDGKEPGAFRTIGEVGKALGIRQHVLRYWEEQFPMLRPLTRAGGRRYYRPSDIALVMQIDRLVHAEGYTIRGARQAMELAARGGAPLAKIAPPDSRLATQYGTVNQQTPAVAEEELVEAIRLLRNHLQSIHDQLSAAISLE